MSQPFNTSISAAVARGLIAQDPLAMLDRLYGARRSAQTTHEGLLFAPDDVTAFISSAPPEDRAAWEWLLGAGPTLVRTHADAIGMAAFTAQSHITGVPGYDRDSSFEILHSLLTVSQCVQLAAGLDPMVVESMRASTERVARSAAIAWICCGYYIHSWLLKARPEPDDIDELLEILLLYACQPRGAQMAEYLVTETLEMRRKRILAHVRELCEDGEFLRDLGNGIALCQPAAGMHVTHEASVLLRSAGEAANIHRPTRRPKQKPRVEVIRFEMTIPHA